MSTATPETQEPVHIMCAHCKRPVYGAFVFPDSAEKRALEIRLTVLMILRELGVNLPPTYDAGPNLGD